MKRELKDPPKIKIQKFYYKLHKTPTGWEHETSDKPKEGLSLHGVFVKEGKEYDEYFISPYNGQDL
jgi:hypothetical protein